MQNPSTAAYKRLSTRCSGNTCCCYYCYLHVLWLPLRPAKSCCILGSLTLHRQYDYCTSECPTKIGSARQCQILLIATKQPIWVRVFACSSSNSSKLGHTVLVVGTIQQRRRNQTLKRLGSRFKTGSKAPIDRATQLFPAHKRPSNLGFMTKSKTTIILCNMSSEGN